MPRQARQSSASEYQHIIVRGIGKQVLFEDRKDYLYFLSKQKDYCAETQVKVCSYCLMENHVHLLLLDEVGKTALLMKKLGVSYSYYFNHKYERVGHLFQDRYMSEAILDDAYLLTVFRYILNNPVKAGICPAEAYEWSSYHAYGAHDSFADTRLLEEMIGGKDDYVRFLAVEDEAVCMEYQAPPHDDAWAERIIRKKLGVSSGTALQQMDRQQRNEAIQLLKREGLTTRQIERLTGISRGVIQNVKYDNKNRPRRQMTHDNKNRP